MTKQRSVWLWFAAASAVFFTRAFLFSSYVSRGPEIQAALHLDTAQMGILSMLYPAGGLVGISFAGSLVRRFGSRKVNTTIYLVSTIAFVVLGTAIDAGNVTLAGLCLVLTGLPMAFSDFIGNLEATGVNNASKHSLFTAIHALFGAGMLLAASYASWMIGQHVSITTGFLTVGLFTGVLAIAAGFAFRTEAEPRGAKSAKSADDSVLRVWSEKRNLLLALIGFSFIMAETSAGTWVPIALTQVGFTGSAAAFAFGFFWIVVTIGRLMGGLVVDWIGRRWTIFASAIMTALGILIFMGGHAINLPYIGLVFWGLGMSAGFPLTVSVMGDDPDRAPARINMIITVVYISSVTVGPALGGVGQSFGLYAAFAIPLTLLLISAALSGVTKKADSE